MHLTAHSILRLESRLLLSLHPPLNWEDDNFTKQKHAVLIQRHEHGKK